MKKTKFFTVLVAVVLCLCFGLAACTNGKTDSGSQSGTPSPVEEKEYTVKFMDGNTVIYEETAPSGTFVEIPEDLTSSDPRITFAGWDGISATEMEEGYVEVFSSDATYTAKWYEIFGSDKTFEAVELRNVGKINVDGEEEEFWNDATAYALDENGSTVKFIWDNSGIYLFADIKGEVENDDNLEVKIDLLHTEEYATGNWNGTDWGDKYRGNRMVEGGYVVKAGSDKIDTFYFEWLSNGAQSDATAKSVVTGEGFTVEMKIGTTNGSIPTDCRPHVDQVIGLAVRNLHEFEKGNTVALENFQYYMDRGPKSLSNVKLTANENNNIKVLSAVEVRENHEVKVDGTADLLYKDAKEYTFGSSKIKFLWGGKNVYAYATLGANTATLAFNGEIFGENGLTFDGTESEKFVELDEMINDGDYCYITVTYTEGTNEKTEDYLLKLDVNPQNFGRNLWKANKTSENITVDGQKDAAYDYTYEIEIKTVSEGKPLATGKAYIMWDDSYLYLFVEVTDADVTTEQRGEPYKNDSVELWISTCRTLPTSGAWGDANRPYHDYCGEGGFRVVSCNNNLSGQHWMYDWADGVSRQTAAVITETGYNVEMKIGWSTFAEVENKAGEMINIVLNINDNNGQKNNARDGVMSTNVKGVLAWDAVNVLDDLLLVDETIDD